MQRATNALILVLLVCVGVRAAAWVIEPVLAPLTMLGMFAIIGWLLLRGSTSR